MATREAFEYAAWCAGPSVDINPPADFPICTVMSYAQPTLALHHVGMTLPDLAPAPLCPCIWTFNTEQENSTFALALTNISVAAITAMLEICPVNGLNQDCCAPEFNVNVDIKLPCMPFEPSLGLSINTGAFTGSFYKDVCKLKLDLKLSLPPATCTCIKFSVVATGTAVGPSVFFDIALTKNVPNCLVKLSYKLSIPCLPLHVADAQSIAIGKGVNPTFDLALSKLANCTLKLSGKISLPCMPFNVADAHTLIIGPGGFGGAFDLALSKLSDCTLKLSGKISLPGKLVTVIVSAEYANKTFKVWKRVVKAYDFGSPSEKQIFVAISCDE